MYKIDKKQNKILKAQERTFSDLGFKERENLQEWIANEPSSLGEELLIIQKEFSGFADTQERLDLLALDKRGALVIIENKLDDSGKDITWQALKYASYCSGLSKANIAKIYQQYLEATEPGTNAEERISDFMDSQDFEEVVLNKGVSQRIILVAAKFRKEATSTVLWLMNFKIRLQCFRATPFAMDEELFLSIEQIIPTPDAEDYMIGMAEKAQDDIKDQAKQKTRHILYKEFWSKLLQVMNAKSTLCQNLSPNTRHYIGAGSGVSGVRLDFVATKAHSRAELYIDYGDKSKNEWIFDVLEEQKKQIESDFGGALVWERLDKKQACRIKIESNGNVTDKEQWDDMIEFMTDSMVKLEKALKLPLKNIGAALKV